LKAIDDGSYCICQTCGNEIPVERLEAVPTHFFALNTPQKTALQMIGQSRKVFSHLHVGITLKIEEIQVLLIKKLVLVKLHVLGFRKPSDYAGDHDSYNSHKTEDDTDGFTEDYESFLG
jgi:hypothetical protein